VELVKPSIHWGPRLADSLSWVASGVVDRRREVIALAALLRLITRGPPILAIIGDYFTGRHSIRSAALGGACFVRGRSAAQRLFITQANI